MSERGAVGEAVPVALARAPVVAAKLRRPSRRAGELRRDRLVRGLCAAAVPVVAVRAPAGYGKTTTVRQWVEEDTRPAAWLSLDGADNDPVRFVRHVVRAIDGVVPVPEVEGRLAVEPPHLVAVLPALATALADQAPLVLVLDDVHVLEADPVVELLARLPEALPPGSTLGLVGRDLPPVGLARHVVLDAAVVLRRNDLAFSAPESCAVIAGSLPQVGHDQAVRLHDRTEGWPAGLHLSLLAAKAGPDPVAILTDLPRRAEDLGAYVHEELLRRLDPELRDFLVRTSVVDRLSPALCDAVLEREDSGRVLRALAGSENLFVVTHDDDPDALRYHHLFADLLLAELRAESPALEGVLRRRAAVWLDAHGDPDAAVTQALAAGDHALAATIAYRHGHEMMQRGSIGTIERWLAGFATDELQRNPLLQLLHGWVDVGQGRPDDLRRRLELVAEASWDGPLPDGTASLAVARASLAMLWSGGGVKQTASDARVVREAGPGGSPWWGTACMLEATARALADREADAVALLEEAEFAARGNAVTHALCLAHLAWARFTAGDDEAAVEIERRAHEELEAHHLEDYNLGTNVHAVHAFVLARQGRRAEYEAAADHTLALLASLAGGVPRAQCQVRLVLADAALALGDPTRAGDLVRVAETFLAAEPDAVVLWDWVDRLRDQLAARARRERLVSGYGLTPAELRVLARLPTHETFPEIGRALYLSRNTVKTHAVAIYRKLGVSGRSAAVARARALGLLDDRPAGVDGP